MSESVDRYVCKLRCVRNALRASGVRLGYLLECQDVLLLAWARRLAALGASDG